MPRRARIPLQLGHTAAVGIADQMLKELFRGNPSIDEVRRRIAAWHEPPKGERKWHARTDAIRSRQRSSKARRS